VFRVFVFPKEISVTRVLPVFVAVFIVGVASQASAQGKMQSFNGLEMTPVSVERAAVASLKDCPPGTNTVNATTRPGEEFAVVTVRFKVTPAFKAGPMKRPQLIDGAGKAFSTSAQFYDVASQPEYSCALPFRVPTGTAVKSLQVETVTLDLTGLEKK